MENTFPFLFASKKSMSSEKNTSLLQIIVVISSGILSSSAIATALKAWFENRKTKLTIHIDERGKTLTYEGHHLHQDAPTIHTIVEQLSQHSDVVIPIEVVISPLRDDGQKEADALSPGPHQENSTYTSRVQALWGQSPSLLKRFLPAWLRAHYSVRERIGEL